MEAIVLSLFLPADNDLQRLYFFVDDAHLALLAPSPRCGERGAQDVVATLVPDMGGVRESTRITRGGIQRVLHGLGE